MPVMKTPPGRRTAAWTMLPILLLAGACARTTILSSRNLSHDPPDDWRDYEQLPVTVVGDIPNRSRSELAALFPTGAGPSDGRHVVFYVNPSRLPPETGLCGDGAAFRPGTQHGDATSVTGALCDGNKNVSRATGTVLTAGLTPRWLAQGFGVIRYQLFQALFPRSNNPAKYETQ